MKKAIRGIIFNIQQFSIHDGPGIRTVVFFKGCPLRCRWCSNPESQSTAIQILWDGAKCSRCRRCVGLCPPGAVRYEEEAGTAGPQAPGRIRINHGRCTGCGICVEACPSQALSLAGRYYSVDEVVEQCLKDRVFYDESGGGVTLAGGEVLAQPEFAEALLTALGEAGIHRAIETSGHAPAAVFDRISARTDLILFDIKHHAPDRHRAGTGVPQDLILANLRTALGRAVLVRIPVIPGYNDHPSDAAALGELLGSLGVREVELLPFHQFGQRKYAMLGLDYGFEKTKALHPEDLEHYQGIFENHGIKVLR
ncbi:glycyl-radical enzyme activating protein [Treponema sp. TIM-1]|uniref:glycyl-radical enzyme activating protein n=1 Tax=Treponema sp. TIM-1 TaxID=2898417 RepID=UPI00397F4125